MAHVRSKTRSLCQIILKPYSPSRDHSFALIFKELIKMFVLMISWSSRNVGHVGSKTRSLGHFSIKVYSPSRGHSFAPFIKLYQKVFLMISWSSLNMDHAESKTRSDFFKTLFTL